MNADKLADALRYAVDNPDFDSAEFDRRARAALAEHDAQPAQAAQPVGDLRVEVQSVAVSDAPDAHQVWLRRGVQQFPVGDYRDTREEAEWYAGQLRTALQPVGVPDVFDFAAHLQRQRGWSGATFGPGARVQGVVDHIRKELKEIEADPGDLKEWIDVVILALDGAWRSGASPSEIIDALVSKQTKNEGRVWPDWRTADPNKAIEHDRSKDAAPQPSADAEDAARYRWLTNHCFDESLFNESEDKCEVDSRIDAARAAEGRS